MINIVMSSQADFLEKTIGFVAFSCGYLYLHAIPFCSFFYSPVSGANAILPSKLNLFVFLKLMMVKFIRVQIKFKI